MTLATGLPGSSRGNILNGLDSSSGVQVTVFRRSKHRMVGEPTVHIAFCPAAPVFVRRNRGALRPRHAAKRPQLRPSMATAGPPRRVGAAVQELRSAMQSALSARQSRLAVRLPDGARLGLEKGGADGAAGFVRGDRELARCVAALFDKTGLSVCVVFPAAGEMRTAIKSFGPMTECKFDCWESGSTGAVGSGGSRKERRKKARGGSAAVPKGAGAGFGAAPIAAPEAQPGSVMKEKFDVYIVVAPKQTAMARAQQLAERFGDETLVIVLNSRLESMQGLPAKTEEHFTGYEDVYYWAPDPSPTFQGGVLFRRFPDNWIVGRATPIGGVQTLLDVPERPSIEEVTEALRKEAQKPTTGLINKVSDFLN